MRIVNVFLLFLLLSSNVVLANGAQEYLLQAGDVLNISVWGNEELQLEGIAVRPDGKVSFPLAGEIEASGLTPAAFTNSITLSLGEYVKDPRVTVNILKYHTTRVYVLGEVVKPGVYELEKQHNLIDAISAASSYNKEAAKKKVFIIRKDSQDKPIRANLLNLLEKGDMTQNYALNEGDIVFLSNNGRIDFAREILPWISAVYQIDRIGE